MNLTAMDVEETFNYPDTDLDLSFTSTTTDRTFASSSARSSLARSSLTLSFNESHLSNTNATTSATLHHRKSDPRWSAIKTATTLSSDGKLHLRHFKLDRHLGTGNLGRVFLCHLRDYNDAVFALKVIDKDLLTKKKLSHVQMEAEILSLLDHPFLPTLYAHLEVSHYTCLLIDYCSNGDLHSLLRKQPGYRLPIEAVRFYAAEVLVALEYLHVLGVVYRDLKPENILLREDGHIMLSDFDLCFKADVAPTFKTIKSVRPTRKRCGCFGSSVHRRGEREEVVAEFVAEPVGALSMSCVGTHEYLAPELVAGNGHGSGVDWWAFGILIYEMMHGTTPFKGGSKESTLRNIVSNRQARCHVLESEEDRAAGDLIEKLLVKDSRKRLGCARGATDIKQHPFFDGIKWPLIRNYKPPEVRGLIISKGTKSHVSHVKRRCWWQRLQYFIKRRKNKNLSGYYHHLNSNHSNSNYYKYRHVNNNQSRKYV